LRLREIDPDIFCDKIHKNNYIQKNNIANKRMKKRVFVNFEILMGIRGSPCSDNQTKEINQ
jgi:hypothetical protein